MQKDTLQPQTFGRANWEGPSGAKKCIPRIQNPPSGKSLGKRVHRLTKNSDPVCALINSTRCCQQGFRRVSGYHRIAGLRAPKREAAAAITHRSWPRPGRGSGGQIGQRLAMATATASSCDGHGPQLRRARASRDGHRPGCDGQGLRRATVFR